MYKRQIDTYIKNLRKKLRLDCIVTVKGIGYKYEVTAVSYTHLVAPVSHCGELAFFIVDFSGKLLKYVAADPRLLSICLLYTSRCV